MTNTPHNQNNSRSTASSTAAQQGSGHRQHLVDAFGERTTSALEGLIDERTAAALAANAEQLAELAEQVRVMRAQFGDQPEVRRAAAQVADATRQHNVEVRTAQQGEADGGAADNDNSRTGQAREEVDQARQALDQRLGALETMTAARQGSDRANRLEDIEADVTGLTARVDQLEAGQHETQVVSATAWASAKASGGSALQAAGRVALVALGVVFLVYAFIVLVSPLEWGWNWALGLPAVVAGIAAAVAYLRADSDGPSSESSATVDAIVNRWRESSGGGGQQAQQNDDSRQSGPGQAFREGFSRGRDEARERRVRPASGSTAAQASANAEAGSAR